MASYPNKFDWVFEHDGTPYKLKCKEKMFWECYKMKLTDVEVLDKSLDKAQTRDLKQAIIDGLNEELK